MEDLEIFIFSVRLICSRLLYADSTLQMASAFPSFRAIE